MIVFKAIGMMGLVMLAVVAFFVLIAVATKIICWIYEKLFL